MSLRNPLLSATAVGALALVSACSSTRDLQRTRRRGADGQRAGLRRIRPGDEHRGGPGGVAAVGAGAILGAVIGGVVGNQFGSGTGRALATGAGIVGGAAAGNAVENRNKRDDEVYRVWIRLDNGVMRSLDFHRVDDLRVGDRVRYEGGQLYRY
jgi:hypothetical protein